MFKFVGLMLIAVSVLSLAVIAFSPGSIVGLESPMQGPERLSPSDRIDSSQLSMTANGLLVKGLTGIRIVNIADTNSMDPVIDAEATVVETIPKTSDELHLGDIISYKSGDNLIIHRIIEISSDENGWFATVKGDNNSVPDPDKVRFEQIKGVVVGILY